MINTENIPFELQKLTNLFTHLDEKKLKKIGLTFSQYRVLKLISENIFQQNIISKELKISEPAVSRQIKNLKFLGYLKNKKGEIILTKKGTIVFEKAKSLLSKTHESIFRIIPEREAKSFYTNLLLLKKFIEKG